VTEAAHLDLRLYHAHQQIGQQLQNTVAQIAEGNRVAFANYAEQQDQLFNDATAEDLNTPEKRKMATQDVFTYLQERLGMSPEEIYAAWTGDASFRSARAQVGMLDSARHYKVAKSIASGQAKAAAEKRVPPVQRPGVSAPRSGAEGEVKAALRAMQDRPTPKNAARLAQARRRAAE
jgi:uncharacterized protein (DUF2267 family)